jgi:hypothetical protein
MMFWKKDDIAIAVKEIEWSHDYLWIHDYQHFGNRYWSRYSSKNAMNRINAADREKTVAEFEAEASKLEL